MHIIKPGDRIATYFLLAARQALLHLTPFIMGPKTRNIFASDLYAEGGDKH